jgi:GDP-L-fucose synthase
MAEACVYLIQELETPELVNIGAGKDTTIKELAEIMKAVVGFEGRLEFDTSKPDGTPRKLLDVSKLARMGWRAKILLREGIAATYRWFVENQGNLRK